VTEPSGSAAIVPLPATADPAAIFAPIAGEPPLTRVVGMLLGRVAQPRIVIAAAEALVARAHDVLAAHGWSALAIVAAPEPGDRRSALAAGLRHLVHEGASTASILVHDYRYPLVPGEVADRVVAALAAGGRVVVPVVPVTDSVKSVDDAGTVESTVDRATLRAVQYPRGFTAAALADLLALDGDELDVALATGQPISTVDGHADGVRFTLPADAELLDAIITCRD
jgi:2-C-methyl-D-erythritol 4-phosphate cytidylyltransferase